MSQLKSLKGILNYKAVDSKTQELNEKIAMIELQTVETSEVITTIGVINYNQFGNKS